ncbi:hypothetical protein QC999_gp66 [Microbacterium phage Cressida]|uniref:Uncharacterized protein n=1 Tax=Microbacterium phage Cressida TaxID=2591216 RepID=A0A514DI59_9CAUD|nr:hypothetical protein QC999_gp66 [Microbacterium phage Cressida]QDH93284.1 hypothetical protein PBI_CRESSIDA_42 [Microbacterium phage Cressida]
MYSGLPTKERRRVQAALVFGWVSATGAGISAAFNPTSVTLLEMGPVIAAIMGLTLSVSAVAAIVGILGRQYRIEWVAAWLAAAGFVPYSITIWSLTITLNLSWLTAAFISTVCLAFFVSRAMLCAAHAAKLRIAHETTETITAAFDGVKGDTDGDGAR